MIETGISIYFGTGYQKNKEILKKAIENGMHYIFTSLHIPEEQNKVSREQMKDLLLLCKEANIQLIADVGPETYETLGISKIEELHEFGITHLRLDYGFSAEETVRIAKTFHVVFNASTITEEDLRAWEEAGADFRRFSACHNFYPKKYTALTMERVASINQRLKYLGFTTIAFVPGNKELRGPIFEGLPTVEAHRDSREEVLYNTLAMHFDGKNDIVMVGDIDIQDICWQQLGELNKGYVSLGTTIEPEYSFLSEQIHHDRPDDSAYVIRSQESRQYYKNRTFPATGEVRTRECGDIFISNERYLRYMGELEIARCEMTPEDRVNIIGKVENSYLKYLPYIQQGMGFRFI